jgi:RNA polymerase sigma factor (sigma-70 family)
MTTTDGRLTKKLAHDLDGAFPDLVSAMEGPVFNGARRWLPSRQDAEDVTQEVFVRAYRALQGYPEERIRDLRLRAWLLMITLNLCRNHFRTRSRRPRQVAIDTTDPAATEEVESDAVAALSVDEWRRRLDLLSGPQRDAIVLRHVVGLSYGEISEVLGKPSGTIKSDVHRGLERLRSILRTEGIQ